MDLDASANDALDDALDEALTLLAPYGPSFRGGLSNHGPMAAEALVALGQAESVVSWVSGYKRRLEPRSKPTAKIRPAHWRLALGDSSRSRDWEDFFAVQLAESSWKDILARWVPRLSPGIAAAGLHGVIRVGHAACALRAKESPERLDELARALGYWASEYMLLPGKPKAAGKLSPAKALHSVEILPRDRRRGGGLITTEMRALIGFEPFAGVIDLVDPSAGDPNFMSELVGTFAGVYANTPSSHFEFLHGVTGTAAVTELLPYVKEEDRPLVRAYAWQVTAGLYARYGTDGLTAQVAKTPAKEAAGRLGAEALAIGDDHTIKLAAAAKREYERHPDGRLLLAAQRRFDRRR